MVKWVLRIICICTCFLHALRVRYRRSVTAQQILRSLRLPELRVENFQHANGAVEETARGLLGAVFLFFWVFLFGCIFPLLLPQMGGDRLECTSGLDTFAPHD